MTALSPERDALVSARFAKRFLLGLALIHLAGGAVLFVGLRVALSKPLDGSYSAVFAALRQQVSLLVPVLTYAGAVYVLLVSLATTVLCVRALHKIAGPLYRMERALENFLAGEIVRPAFVREGDQVAALASSFNGFVGCLRQDRQNLLGMMRRAERLCFQDRAACRADMDKALVEMENLLAKYR
ncbi:MAG: hypothetical protein ACM31I_04480 [Deltaproteobacteria bacterium]